MGEFSVEPDKLTDDSETWGAWREQLMGIGSSVPTLGQDLNLLDFSFLPNAPQVAHAYAAVSELLASEIGKGAEQFKGVADKLIKVANVYSQTEQRLVDAMSAEDD